MASLWSAFVVIGVYFFRLLSPHDFLPASVLIMVVPSLIAAFAAACYVRQ